MVTALKIFCLIFLSSFIPSYGSTIYSNVFYVPTVGQQWYYYFYVNTESLITVTASYIYNPGAEVSIYIQPNNNITGNYASYSDETYTYPKTLVISPCDSYFTSNAYYYVMTNTLTTGYYNLTIESTPMPCYQMMYDYTYYYAKLNGGQWLYFYYSGSSSTNIALSLQDSSSNSLLYKGTTGSYYPTLYSFDYFDSYVIYWNTTCSSTNTYIGYFGVYCSVGLCDFSLYPYDFGYRECYESLTSGTSTYQSVPYTPGSLQPYFGFYFYLSYPGSSTVYIYSSSYISIYVATTSPPQTYPLTSGTYSIYLYSYQISSSSSNLYIAVQSDSSFYITATETYTGTPNAPTYSPYYSTPSYNPTYPSFSTCYLTQTTYTAPYCSGSVLSITSVPTSDLSGPILIKESNTYGEAYCSDTSVYYKSCGSDSSCKTGSYSSMDTSCQYINLFSPKENYGNYYYYQYGCTCGGSSLVASVLLFLTVSMYLLTQN